MFAIRAVLSGVLLLALAVAGGLLVVRYAEEPPTHAPAYSAAQFREILARREELERVRIERQRFMASHDRVKRQLLAGVGLRAAVGRLQATAVRQYPRFLEFLEIAYRGQNDRERLARHLIRYVELDLESSPSSCATACVLDHLRHELEEPAFRQWCARGEVSLHHPGQAVPGR